MIELKINVEPEVNAVAVVRKADGSTSIEEKKDNQIENENELIKNIKGLRTI